MTTARWGGIVAVGVAAALVLMIVLLEGRDGPCAQARQAYTTAVTSPDSTTRATALTLYYVKRAECEASGGTVGP